MSDTLKTHLFPVKTDYGLHKPRPARRVLCFYCLDCDENSEFLPHKNAAPHGAARLPLPWRLERLFFALPRIGFAGQLVVRQAASKYLRNR